MSFLVLKAYLKLIHFDLYLARGNFAALYDKVRRYPVGKQAPAPDAVERICCCGRHGLHLVLERSAVPATVRGHGMSAEETRRSGADGHRRAADAVQSPRVGRSRRPRGQRQAVYAGNVCSSRSVLESVCKSGRGTNMSVQFGRWNFDGKPVDRGLSRKSEAGHRSLWPG